MIPQFLTSHNQYTVRLLSFPFKNSPKTHKTQKSSQIDSRRLAVVHHRQVAQTKPRNLGESRMCRLAARVVPLSGSSLGTQNYSEMHVLPGGNSLPARQFLENSRNLKFKQDRE